MLLTLKKIFELSVENGLWIGENDMNENMDLESVMASAKTLFFVGIGGISMSSLAVACRRRGYRVSGSDRAHSSMTEKLEKDGMSVVYEHRAENIEGADAVVYTGAVSFDNPELAAAMEKGIPLIYRADLLGYIMKNYVHRIGVAGMHGKSTCTSMLAHLFMHAGRKPTVISGAETEEMGGAYTVGEKEYFIFEACEYKDSFLCFFPTVSIVLGIDLDHTDYFSGGISQIKRSFTGYANLPFAGDALFPFSVLCADDKHTREILPDVQDAVTFGIESEDAVYRAVEVRDSHGRFSFDVLKMGEFLTHISLSVVGYHNIYNALAAVAVGDMLGLSERELSEGLETFRGLRRRFEYCGSLNGADVYIDYAHHPREIAATLAGAKKMTEGRLLCFFEPHTYSRTAALFEEFTASFDDAYFICYLDIYAAREDNVYGVTSEKLAAATPKGRYAASYEEAARIIRAEARKDDTVMILGAGTVDRIAGLLFGCK